MAEINLGNENEINVNISTDTNIGATVPDINYIPGYQIAEEERRANEVIRQSNEADRIALYEDMENKLATGYFDGVGLNYDWEGTSLGVKREDESEYSYTDLKGDTGNDGVSPSASVTRGTGSATITVTDASGTTTAVIYDGEKGDKGDKGDPGEVNIIVVEELPETGVEDTIYLVPLAEPDVQGNNYAEYIYINGAWELLGKVGIATDLTDYVKNTDYASLSKAGVVKTNSYSGFNVGNGGGALCDSVTYSQYEGRINDSFISKGTLENVITGKGLVASSSLSTVATSGSYNDLSNKPTIPDELADLTDDSTHRLVTDADKTNWNNKVDANGEATTTSENTSFTLTDTLEAPLLMDLKGNTQQTGTPTPSSPIHVNVVSGDNYIVVCDANIYNYDNDTNYSHLYLDGSGNFQTDNTTNYVNEKINIISNKISIYIGSKSGAANIRLGQFKSDGTFISRTLINQTTNNITFDNECSYIWLSSNKDTTTNYYFTNVSIIYGSSISSYIPYTGTTYNIDLPEGMELCKIGNYQDYFYKQDDKWYLHKEIEKVVLDGSEDIVSNPYGTNSYSTKISTLKYGVTNEIIVLSNYFKGVSYNERATAGNNIVFNDDNAMPGYKSITIRNTTFTSANDFKTWLSTHNTNVYYLLETATNTEITYTPLINQLNTLEEASSYEGTTNINQVNNDLPFIIDATVFNDNYNGRYKALLKRIEKLEENA